MTDRKIATAYVSVEPKINQEALDALLADLKRQVSATVAEAIREASVPRLTEQDLKNIQRNLGEAVYEAYREAASTTGRELSPWWDITADERENWRAAADALKMLLDMDRK